MTRNAQKSVYGGGRTRGKQVYLGGFAREKDAARTWDIAAMKWGLETPLNFPRGEYAHYEALMTSCSREEMVAWLKSRGVGTATKGGAKKRRR